MFPGPLWLLLSSADRELDMEQIESATTATSGLAGILGEVGGACGASWFLAGAAVTVAVVKVIPMIRAKLAARKASDAQ